MRKKTSPVITQFLSYKGFIQNRSPLTVGEYSGDLHMFFRFLLSNRGGEDSNADGFEPAGEIDISAVDAEFIASVTTSEIYEFLLYLARTKKLSPRTMARKLSAIKGFFKYHAVKSKLIPSDPAKEIDSPTVKQTLPKYLSLEESITLLGAVDKTKPFYERDYCILTLFLNCGMRLSELVGINLSDIDSDLIKMTVIGKGRKPRIVYLNAACRAAVSNYLPKRDLFASKCSSPIDLSSKDALFLSRFNRRISNKTVQWLVKKHLAGARLGGKGYSTHKLRHTAATLMYNQGGVDIRTLKDILGHEQLNTTQIYTHVSDKALEKAMDQNPLSAHTPAGGSEKKN